MGISPKNITVLMSVFNDACFLKTSVQSILNQSHREFEFLIIDDGSTDNTEDVIKTFRDSRISYKKIAHSGLASALNYGLENSNGEWIARIDADDLSTSDRLKTQIDFSLKHPEYDVISSWSIYFKSPHKVLFFLKTPKSDKGIKTFLNLHNPINHSTVFFYKKKVLDYGGYDTSLKSYEDFELWFRLKNTLKFKTIPECLAYTRLRDDSMTKRGSKNHVYDMLMSNAKTNFKNSRNGDLKKYWNNILFWIEYFYGNKSDARNYFTKDLSFKKAVAFLNTFLPDKAFDYISGLRIRYRIQSQFENKKNFKNELKVLLADKL